MQVFLSILFLLLLFTIYKIVQLLPERPWVAVAVTVVLFVMMFSTMFLYRGKPSVYDEFWFRALSWSGSAAMGLWATFVIVTLPVDLFRLGVFAAEKISGSELISPARFQGAYAMLALLSLALVTAGTWTVWRGPEVKTVDVPVENLAAGLKGLKIAQISDLHVGANIRESYVREVVARTNAIEPDLILFTGDIADGHHSTIATHMRPLAELKARYGLFYVTGNHEYYWGAENLIRQFETLGIEPLINASRMLQIGGARLAVAGVSDPQGAGFLPGHAPDLPRAASGSKQSEFSIILAHRPGVAEEAEKLGFDLQLSGHTHSGQFFPFSLFIGFAHPFNRGLYRLGKMWIHVNPGTGYWGPPNRLGVAPEITLLTLKAAD